MKLLVTTSEYFDAQRGFRLEYILRNLASIAEIKTDYTRVIIISNPISNLERKILTDHFSQFSFDIELRSAVQNLDHNYFLAWEHKSILKDFTNSDFTHFVYLENDLELKQKHLDYWIETSDLFKRNNLKFIPAFHRYEYDQQGNMVSLDCTDSVHINQRPKVTVEGKRFISLRQPYHAMYVMDKEAAEIHLNSKSSKFNTANTTYAISERAALGNMYEQTPYGFDHSCLFPLDDVNRCLIHHMPNKFVNIINDTFGKLPINDVVLGK